MPDYCFSLTLDGAEQPMRTAAFSGDDAAIEHGRAELMSAVEVKRPAVAYCAVFESVGVDTEPLGAWDYSREDPTPRWSAEE